MYLPLFLCPYESFQKGFESDQRRLTLLVIKMRLLVWCVVNKTLKFRLTFLILLILFTLEEIRKASTKLKTCQAAGNDSISNEMIKSSVSIIGPVLQIPFNKVLHSGIFPQLWSLGYISPVFKAGDIGDPNNYRGFFTLTRRYGTYTSTSWLWN